MSCNFSFINNNYTLVTFLKTASLYDIAQICVFYVASLPSLSDTISWSWDNRSDATEFVCLGVCTVERNEERVREERQKAEAKGRDGIVFSYGASSFLEIYSSRANTSRCRVTTCLRAQENAQEKSNYNKRTHEKY